jgi:hypothetical protein
MSATSTTSPTSPIQRRDIRSAAQAFKRDKDASEKWANGVRPSAGVSFKNLSGDELIGGSEAQQEKVRPRKQWSQVYASISPPCHGSKLTHSSYRSSDHKTHANKNPRSTANTSHTFGLAGNRLERKVDAMLESNDPAVSNLSKSLLELLPQHANNTDSAIHTALKAEAGVLYSFDNKGASPGSSVALGGLVEQAEKKWLSEQTDRIVKGEYEVLDAQGETTVLKGKKKSPKQKATQNAVKEIEEDDGFELI